jgi:hypothetical protein
MLKGFLFREGNACKTVQVESLPVLQSNVLALRKTGEVVHEVKHFLVLRWLLIKADYRNSVSQLISE